MAQWYVVKNTFISLEDEECSNAFRRSNSEPSLFVPEDHGSSPCKFDAQCDDSGTPTAAPPESVPAPMPLRGWGKKATVPNPPRGWTNAAAPDKLRHSSTSEAPPRGWGVVPKEDCAMGVGSLMEQATCAQTAHCLTYDTLYDKMSQCNEGFYGSAPSSASTIAPNSVAWDIPDDVKVSDKDMVMGTNAEDRHRLNPRAKAWEPSYPQQTQMPMGMGWMCDSFAAMPFAYGGNQASHNKKSTTELKVKIGNSVSELRCALKNHPRVVRVDVLKGQNFWNITARLSRTDFDKRKEDFLSIARSALLRANDESSGVFLLGYQEQPFVEAPDGFSCMLGGMEDPSCACWDTFSTGICKQKRACAWQHPVSRTVVNVMLKLADA